MSESLQMTQLDVTELQLFKALGIPVQTK